MSVRKYKEATGKDVRRCLATSVGVLMFGASMTAAAQDITGSAGTNARTGTEFTFSVDAERGCRLTIHSSLPIRRFSVRNANGRRLRSRRARRGVTSLSVFTDLLIGTPDATILIRTDDRVWSRMNAEPNLAVAECLEPDEVSGEELWGTCPCVTSREDLGEAPGAWISLLGGIQPTTVTMPGFLGGTTDNFSFQTEAELRRMDGSFADILAAGNVDSGVFCEVEDFAPPFTSARSSHPVSSFDEFLVAISDCRTGLFGLYEQELPIIDF